MRRYRRRAQPTADDASGPADLKCLAGTDLGKAAGRTAETMAAGRTAETVASGRFSATINRNVYDVG
jgi:hypothetical protein